MCVTGAGKAMASAGMSSGVLPSCVVWGGGGGRSVYEACGRVIKFQT